MILLTQVLDFRASTTGERWTQLWYLLYRYRLFAPLVEETLAQVLCGEIETRTRLHEFQGMDAIDGPFDEEDSRMVVRGYIKKMTQPGAEFPTAVSPVQLMRVPYEAMQHMKVFELAAKCAQATLPHTWVDIAALNGRCTYDAKVAKNAIDSMHMHVCQAVTQFKEILDVDVAYITPEQRSKFLHALDNGDFIAVIGRALLAFATYFAGRVKVDYGSCRVWRDMMAEIESVATLLKRYPPDAISRIFSASLGDIFKTARQNELIYSLSEPSSHVYKFARDSKAVLERLTVGLGMMPEQDQLLDALLCAYSRCPGTALGGPASAWRRLLVCEGCFSVEYCSRECQINDWTTKHPGPHGIVCQLITKVSEGLGVV